MVSWHQFVPIDACLISWPDALGLLSCVRRARRLRHRHHARRLWQHQGRSARSNWSAAHRGERMEVVSVIMNETLRRDTLLWLKRHRAPRAPQDAFSCALQLFLDLAGHSDFGLAEQLFVKQTLDEIKPSPTHSRRLTLSSCWRHWEPYQMQAPRARTGASC